MLTPEQMLSHLNATESRLREHYQREASSQPVRGWLSDWHHDVTLLERDALAAEYLEAARVIAVADGADKFALINAWVQLAGHAVELSLKTYIAARGQRPALTHDLVQLARDAVSQEFYFADGVAIETVVRLNHLFYKELGTINEYPARYGSQAGAVVPKHDEVAALVQSIRTQFAGAMERS